jgi:hypothetical protein
MRIPCRYRRPLRRIERGLCRSDPHLAAMLVIFAQLYATEAIVSTEQAGHRPAPRWLAWLARTTAAWARWLTRLVKTACAAVRRTKRTKGGGESFAGHLPHRTPDGRGDHGGGDGGDHGQRRA